ncbi:hypothetical protein PVAND_016045 [Polypedilum vanderplanki]|uniref:Peptidase M13 N-terminal domain-containing protein n=1 Tax=Polypedilum vanderplanki TaxID=319348 RepID=A0A9J6BEG6_POLVA|nr:hypothetical protein PVAND_016045 [Polypedilum vanderplanki]
MTKFVNLQNIFLIIFHIHLSHQQPSPYTFKNQFIGKTRYVTPEEEENRNFCTNYWCTNDASYLFTSSSQYTDSDPCVDFKNFSVGKAWEINKVSDRRIYRGLQTLAEMTLEERLRKVLSEKYDSKNDNKIVKIIKNTFRKCLKSPHTFRHIEAHKEAVKYLNFLGGSPYLSRHIVFNPNRFDEKFDYKFEIFPGNVSRNDKLWNKSNFNLSKYFEFEPQHSLTVFYGRRIKRCTDPRDETKEILCIAVDEDFGFIDRPNFFVEIFTELFDTLEDRYLLSKKNKILARNEIFIPAAKNVEIYMRTREEILQRNKNERPVMMTVKELRKLNENIAFDWLKVINHMLMKDSKIDENEEIYVHAQTVKELGENLMDFDKSILADTFVTTFIYSIRHFIILRFHNIQDIVVDGRVQNPQRFERCQISMQEYVKAAIEVMYERKRLHFEYTLGDFERKSRKKNEIYESAKKITEESFETFAELFINQTTIPLDYSSFILKKLKNVKIYIGITNELLKMNELEEYYKDLNLTGDESFLTSMLEMKRNSWKIKNELKGTKRRKIELIVGNTLAFYNLMDENYFYIPTVWTIYPLYHPERPRFFNMARLFQTNIWDIREGVVNFLDKILPGNPQNYTICDDDNFQITYEVYSKWLENHKDLEIGANYLTHKQLYWMAVAVSRYLKFHRIVPKKFFPLNRLQMDYFHIWFKHKPGFQDAFKCKITEEEEKIYQEYLEKYFSIQKQTFTNW